MRALTPSQSNDTVVSYDFCSNEVLAREGIDTCMYFISTPSLFRGSNEVLAREGIDTVTYIHNSVFAVIP